MTELAVVNTELFGTEKVKTPEHKLGILYVYNVRQRIIVSACISYE